MLFIETALKGAYQIDIQPRADDRGFFARAFCRKEFETQGLLPAIAQANLAVTFHKGTMRGMHFQFPPAAEAKVVRCTRGAVLDVMIDLRPESPTYLQSVVMELTEDNHRALYIPERFAHGYQTLQDSSEITYHATEFYTPSTAAGLRYNDPRLALSWPEPITAVSDQDRNWPLLDQQEAELKRRMSL
jgi:dTDP-4-dehydrorhamnose 3,5-epimerase